MQTPHEHIGWYEPSGKKHGKQKEVGDGLSERQGPFGKYKGAHKRKECCQDSARNGPEKSVAKGDKQVLVMGDFLIGGKIEGKTGQKPYLHGVCVLGIRKGKGQNIQKRVEEYNDQDRHKTGIKQIKNLFTFSFI
jgi:hypothetical protein